MLDLFRVELTTELLRSPFDMNIIRIATLRVRGNRCTQTITIASNIAATSIVIACIKIWAWIYHIMTRTEKLTVDDVTLCMRPWRSVLSHSTRVCKRFSIWTSRLHFPTIAKTFGIHDNIPIWRGKIVVLVIVEVPTKTTCCAWINVKYIQITDILETKE